MDRDDVLIKISSYAKEHNKSTTAIRNWIDKGLLCLEIIDGMKFINVTKSKKK